MRPAVPQKLRSGKAARNFSAKARTSSRPRHGACSEYSKRISGPASSSITAGLKSLPQNSVNQRPTMALFSSSDMDRAFPASGLPAPVAGAHHEDARRARARERTREIPPGAVTSWSWRRPQAAQRRAGAALAAAYRGVMGPELAGREYAGHLTDADLRLLASVAAGPVRTGRAADGSWLRGDPAALLDLLEHPGAFDAVMGQDEAAAGLAGLASPFLVFTVFVQRAATELAAAGHVPERTGPRQRVPLFDAGALREFLAEPKRRLFLAELLASLT